MLDFEELINVIQKHKSKNGQVSYNIFDTLGVKESEVIMCRFLADLLDPNGSHKQGDKFLILFIKNILPQYDYHAFSSKCTKVITELGITVIKEDGITDSTRRIDIVIENDKYFIPIEVKINAHDQSNQCYDYYNYTKKYSEKNYKNKQDIINKIVYLTKDGKYPSSDSIKSSDGLKTLIQDNIICISFKQDIANWLDEILNSEIISNNNKDMKIYISQFLNTIKEITNTMNVELYNDIEKKFLNTPENFKCGLEICNAMDTAKANILKNTLQEIEKNIDAKIKKPDSIFNKLIKDERKYYHYDQQATETFYQTNTTYPGINYVVDSKFYKHILTDNLELWFRVEVEHNLFAGFCIYNNSPSGYENHEKEIDKSLESQLSYILSDMNPNKWWACWRYLPSGKTESDLEVPNFKEMNDAAIKLFDEESRKTFAVDCVNIIEKILLKLLRK